MRYSGGVGLHCRRNQKARLANGLPVAVQVSGGEFGSQSLFGVGEVT